MWGRGAGSMPTARELDARDQRTDRVRVQLCRIERGVNEIRGGRQRRIVQLYRGIRAGRAIQVERNVRRIGAEQAPAHIRIAVGRADGDDAAPEVLHDARWRGGIGRQQRPDAGKHGQQFLRHESP